MSSLRTLTLALVLVAAGHASRAHADERRPAPQYRIDVVGPLGGFGVFLAPAASYHRGIFAIAGELRFAAASGDGALVRVGFGSDVWGSGVVVEPAYLRRIRLEGDDRVGVGLDLSIGPSLAVLRHNEDTIPSGNALGGHVGVSLDGRIHNFTMSLAGQYRVLVPLGTANAGNAVGPEHALTLMIGCGFAFYE